MVPLVEIRNLTYRYPESESPVLDDINLTIHEGEFVGIVGPAGAGKTTLCLCMTGLIPQTVGGRFRGEVALDGTSTRSGPVARLLFSEPGSALAAITFQDPESQIVGLSVEEDTAFALENIGLPAEEIQSRIDTTLQQLGLSQLRHAFPYHLSGGQKQRVAIAAALALSPRLLILDEPTSELDPVGKEEVFQVVAALKRNKRLTVVMVEHEVEELVRYADRVVVMNAGRIAMTGTPHEVFTRIEELEQIGVRTPEVAQLSRKLGLPPWLTEAEAQADLENRLWGGSSRG